MSRGRTWFEALAGATLDGEPASVLCADGTVGDERTRFLTVVPNAEAKFPRARGGELGLEEGWALARHVREAVAVDDGDRRAIVAVVDVPGQPYGYREELLGLHLALAAAVDAYATARLAGHPVVALAVGQAISGAFLAHGMQAHRILALEDPGVAVQVMSERSTASSKGSTPPNRTRSTLRRCATRSPRRSPRLATTTLPTCRAGSLPRRPADTGARACGSGSGSPRNGAGAAARYAASGWRCRAALRGVRPRLGARVACPSVLGRGAPCAYAGRSHPHRGAGARPRRTVRRL